MSMHLHHPSLSLNGRKKGRVKFRNADEARRSRALDAEWQDLLKRHGIEAEKRRQKRAMTAEPLNYKLSSPRETQRYASLGADDHRGSTAPVHKVYTGTKVKGIATMHKSNAVPVFSDEEAVEISRMRRG